MFQINACKTKIWEIHTKLWPHFKTLLWKIWLHLILLYLITYKTIYISNIKALRLRPSALVWKCVVVTAQTILKRLYNHVSDEPILLKLAIHKWLTLVLCIWQCFHFAWSIQITWTAVVIRNAGIHLNVYAIRRDLHVLLTYVFLARIAV